MHTEPSPAWEMEEQVAGGGGGGRSYDNKLVPLSI